MRKKFLIIAMILINILILNIILNSASDSNDKKIGSDIYKNLEKTNETRVVIEIKDTNIEREKKEIKENIKQDIGKESVKHEFDKELAVSVSIDDLKKLKQNSDVKSVKVDKPIYAFLQNSVPFINATLVWPLTISGTNLTGIGETVCIIDTGVNFSHPDLIGKNKTCIIDCVGKACVKNCSVGDDNGHGTHVAGIAAALGGINGVSIGANLIGVKVLNSAGTGSGSDLNAGIEWCVNNASLYNISVISLSLGDCTNHDTYCNDDSSAAYINSAIAKNISVVVAAGNGPSGSCPSVTDTDGPSAPACIENATAIGAVDSTDTIDYQRGILFEIMAPGVSINSTKSTGGYQIRSGTSMAAPHAAGAFAIIRQAFRLFNNRIPTSSEIRNILNLTGKIINDPLTGMNFARINVYSAVLSLDNSAPNVNLISPANNTVNSSTNQTFLCNATDNLLLGNLTFYIWNSTSLYYNYTNQTSGNFTELNVLVQNLSQGNYKWNCLAYDAKGNPSFADSNFSFDIGNLSVSLSSPLNNLYTNQNQTYFNCSSKTAYIFNLTNITFYLWNSSLDLVYNETKIISGTTNLTSFQYNLSYENNYIWNCEAYNNKSYSSFADNNYSLYYDKTNPIVSSVLSSVGSSSATITWITDENANYSLNYGLTHSLGSNLSSTSFITSHSASLSSLSSSTTYYYNITCCDNAGNCIVNGTYSFTTSAAAIIQQSSSGGGGGGGVASYTYVPSIKQLSDGYTQSLDKNDKIKFTFFDIKSGEHTLTVNEIKQNSINITIKSNTINLLLGIGQSAKLNLTSADYYDLYVKLDNIENNKARLTIQIINEEIPKEPSLTGNAVENKIDEKNETAKKESEWNISFLTNQLRKMYHIIFAVILVFVMIAIIVLIKKNYLNKKENAKMELKDIFNKHVNTNNRR